MSKMAYLKINDTWIFLPLYRKGIDDILKDGWGQVIIRKPDGTISADLQMGEGCADLKRVDISEVSGENWHGWVAENIYSFPKK